MKYLKNLNTTKMENPVKENKKLQQEIETTAGAERRTDCY